MGIETIITTLVIVFTAFGSFYGGRRTSGDQAETQAIESQAVTVDMLQIQTDLLRAQISERDDKILALEAKMEILEAMVTQRAEVEEVKHEVQGVRSVVDRIAHKVGA